jgi:hypothetical protein
MAVPNSNWDQISAITEKYFMPKLQDNIFKTIPLFSRMEKKIDTLSGGTKVMVPLNYAQGAAGGWFNGMDTLNNQDTDTITSAEFEWKQSWEPIVVSRRDELINGGQQAKVNFVKSKMKIAEKTIRDNYAVGLWNAGTTTNAILGIRSFLSASNTYGNISQSTYSFWQSNVDSSTTTTTISAVNSQWSATGLNGDTPSVILSGSARYNNYYNLLQPQQRFMDSDTAKGGFTSLMFNGVPWIMDSKAPSTHVVGLNEEYLHLLFHKDENFRLEPFATPINQNGKVAKIFTMSVFASSNNRMHFALTALTA